MNETFLQRQVIPLVLTVVTCVTLIAAYFGQIHLLNVFTANDISLQIRWYDVLIGMTIYLKTSIDFAIFIGHLMSRNPGYKSRVSIEIATAVGNALGTMVVLTLWTFFKEIRWLLALMVFIASLVLIKMAEDSLEHAVEGAADKSALKRVAMFFEKGLSFVNKAIAPVLNKIIPHASMKAGGENMRFWPLFGVAFSVPFILGLDDFAGYIPLFNVVNVWGFGIGVFLGHMILNILLYVSPSRTIKIVKNPWIAFLGAFAFIALGVWGLYEEFHLNGF